MTTERDQSTPLDEARSVSNAINTRQCGNYWGPLLNRLYALYSFTHNPGRTSGRLTAKSTAIKGLGCRSGRGAGKAIELTWGDLHRVPIPELRQPLGGLTATQESADRIVGHAVGKARAETHLIHHTIAATRQAAARKFRASRS